jgi:hypothetical protein
MDIQTPDTRPGFYYVSVIDGQSRGLLSGPYSTHSEALADVTPAKVVTQMLDPRADFYAFGTCRFETNAGQGALNKAKKFHI